MGRGKSRGSSKTRRSRSSSDPSPAARRWRRWSRQAAPRRPPGRRGPWKPDDPAHHTVGEGPRTESAHRTPQTCASRSLQGHLGCLHRLISQAVCRLGGRRCRATQPHRPLVASNRTNDGHIGPLSMVPRAAGVAGAHTRVPANCRRWFKAADRQAKDPFYTRRSGSGFEGVVYSKYDGRVCLPVSQG